MSNTDTAPAEVDCAASPFAGVLHPREVPLGGPRAIRVRRTLPQRERSLIGAWCFADHYGPHDVRSGPGMDVPPHPHTGLQTVSWLFSGEVEHRDSAGRARDGAARRAEPDDRRRAASATPRCPPRRPPSCTACSCGWRCPIPTATPVATSPISCRRRARSAAPPLRVFLGELVGDRSPVHTFTPLLGAQLDLDPGARGDARRRSRPSSTACCSTRAASRSRVPRSTWPTWRSRPPGATVSSLVNRGQGPARVVLLGGPPFPEQLVMWWNFVGRSHDDIVAVPADVAGPRRPLRCGARVTKDRRHACPRPPLPNATLRPRPNPGV